MSVWLNFRARSSIVWNSGLRDSNTWELTGAGAVPCCAFSRFWFTTTSSSSKSNGFTR